MTLSYGVEVEQITESTIDLQVTHQAWDSTASSNSFAVDAA